MAKTLEHLKGLECTPHPGARTGAGGQRRHPGDQGVSIPRAATLSISSSWICRHERPGPPQPLWLPHGSGPVVEGPHPQVKASIVGPICETGDSPPQATASCPPLPSWGRWCGHERWGLRLFHEFQLQRFRPRCLEILVQDQDFIRDQETGDLPPAYLGRVYPEF